MGIPRISPIRLLIWSVLFALFLAVALWAMTCDGQPAGPGENPAADSRPRRSLTTEDSIATAVAFNEAFAASIPTPTAAADVVGNPPAALCAPPDLEAAGEPPHFLHWTPDGSRLILDLADTIWSVDSRGTRASVVLDLDPESDSRPSYEFYADLSPDGSRLVYSTCEYPLVFSTSEGMEAYHLYEIGSAGLDGGGRQRLTTGPAFESYPVWSPDGNSVAFIREGGPDGDAWVYILEDGSLVPSRWWIGGQNVAAGRYPLAWSPTGGSLALLGYESTPAGRRSCLYTGEAIGPEVIRYRTTMSEVFRVTEATGPPSWSPDGKHIAFTRSGGEDAGVYVVRHNGSEPQLVVDGTAKGPLWPAHAAELLQSHSSFRGSPVWSPDGDMLLFITREITPGALEGSTGFVPSRVFTVDLEDGELVELELPLPEFVRVTAVAWSPDGSRVAVSGDIRQFPQGDYNARRVILTADPDGGNMHILAAGDSDLSLVGGHYDESVGVLIDLTGCYAAEFPEILEEANDDERCGG